MYRTTSSSALSSFSTTPSIVRPPYTRIIRPYQLFECFWVGKYSLSVSQLFQIKVSLLKNAKNLKKLLKINGLFFIKKLISLIVRRRTKRGSTVLGPARLFGTLEHLKDVEFLNKELISRFRVQNLKQCRAISHLILCIRRWSQGLKSCSIKNL